VSVGLVVGQIQEVEEIQQEVGSSVGISPVVQVGRVDSVVEQPVLVSQVLFDSIQVGQQFVLILGFSVVKQAGIWLKVVHCVLQIGEIKQSGQPSCVIVGF
jgi:hypothetical protein